MKIYRVLWCTGQLHFKAKYVTSVSYCQSGVVFSMIEVGNTTPLKNKFNLSNYFSHFKITLDAML